MPKAIESRQAKVPAETRVCLHCSAEKPLADFALNPSWTDMKRRDVWCKDCVRSLTSKKEAQEYYWYNNREWSDDIWNSCLQAATRKLNYDPVYKQSTRAKQRKMQEATALQFIPDAAYKKYKYVDNTVNGEVVPFVKAKAKGLTTNDEGEEEMVYSKEFNGIFSAKDLEYLKDYYAKLEEDFTFDNESLRDYARKTCKASLQADKALDAYATGQGDFSDVKDAMAQFDMLSKSANFAACRRKPGDSGGLTSWSETTYKLETTGFPMTRKIVWEKDDVDKTIDELKHIVKALALDD